MKNSTSSVPPLCPLPIYPICKLSLPFLFFHFHRWIIDWWKWKEHRSTKRVTILSFIHLNIDFSLNWSGRPRLIYNESRSVSYNSLIDMGMRMICFHYTDIHVYSWEWTTSKIRFGHPSMLNCRIYQSTICWGFFVFCSFYL